MIEYIAIADNLSTVVTVQGSHLLIVVTRLIVPIAL